LVSALCVFKDIQYMTAGDRLRTTYNFAPR